MKRFNLNNSSSTAKLFLSACIFLFTLSTNAAQPPIDTGLEIGTAFPELAVLDQFGDKQQLSNITKDKGAVIVLFRSADWCPFCKKHLLELNDEAEDFIEKGYGLAGISYDSPKTLRKFAQKKKLKFSLLSDQNVATFKALNVVNKEYQPGDRHYGIPYPGVLVVDQNGKITHKYFFEGYKDRVKFDELIKKLK